VGLTQSSTGHHLVSDLSLELLQKDLADTIKVALAGNPNTGKSTVFNSLTGLKQHTGNWPGKTVGLAAGEFNYKNHDFVLIDLPGTYSLFADSPEEEIARDFICFTDPEVTVVVVDATCLERNIHLLLQILEITPKVVLCVNLLDEAKKHGISIDLEKLSEILKIRVVGTTARDGVGLDSLKEAILETVLTKPREDYYRFYYKNELEEKIKQGVLSLEDIPYDHKTKRWLAIRLLDGDKSLISKLSQFLKDRDFINIIEASTLIKSAVDPEYDLREEIVSSIYKNAENIALAVSVKNKWQRAKTNWDELITSKAFGIPIMLILLGVVFWLTIVGANYPSQLLASGFSYLEEKLLLLFDYFSAPTWLTGLLILGIFKTVSWVVAVMLPPMAIFFPLFTLLEDWGFLPRIAFNLDNSFRKSGAHGKQSLTMCMGFGCNAAGVVACRIIDSPRERLIAIITNNFVPCNGRFPTLILIITLFFTGRGTLSSINGTLILLSLIIVAVFTTLLVSKTLSKTILKGIPSSFSLELPPYRRPHIGRILIRSLLDRTAFVLGRAIIVAAPAGAIIWILANTGINDQSFLSMFVGFLAPLGYLMGLDGEILSAFILGLPANEIVLPIIYMSYLSNGSLIEMESLVATKAMLLNNGWTIVTAICMMILSLNHFPCGTTLLTIKKETGSWYWSVLSFIIPTVIGIVSCILIAQSFNLITFFLR